MLIINNINLPFPPGRPPGSYSPDDFSGTRVTNPAIGELAQQSGIEFFRAFISKAIEIAFIIGVLIFLFIMIIGAIQWMSSGGDKTALEAARGKVTNAIIGLVVLFLIFVLLKVIGQFFGIEILTLDIGPLKL